jgi:uncharacterized protein (DUF2062 family)
MGRIPAAAKQKAMLWLRQGISPRRLALTLALGFAVGCIPVVGIPTVLCAALAFSLRLNLPVIQAANYAALPFQLALIVPFIRLGGWLSRSGLSRFAPLRPLSLGHAFHLPAFHLAAHFGSLAGQALLAWLLVAVPAVALMTVALTITLRRIPALNVAQAGD